MKTVNEFMKEYGNYNIKDEEAILKLLERPRPKTVWDLQKGDGYWVIWTNGNIGYECWNGIVTDIARRENGNCYLTEGEAVFALEKKKIIAEMKRLGGTENMMSLGDVDDRKYYIWYDHRDSIIHINICTYCHHNSDVYFASKEQVQKAIDTIGEARIKKYIFNVNE